MDDVWYLIYGVIVGFLFGGLQILFLIKRKKELKKKSEQNAANLKMWQDLVLQDSNLKS